MVYLGEKRLEEIKRAQQAIYDVLWQVTIKEARNLSLYETYAAAILAIEDMARSPVEVIRKGAAEVSAKWGVEADWQKKSVKDENAS